MGTVAERSIAGVLATTKINLFASVSCVLQWVKVGTLVRSVAKGLLSATSAAAPVITFAGFDFNSEGCFLSNNGFSHFFDLSRSLDN